MCCPRGVWQVKHNWAQSAAQDIIVFTGRGVHSEKWGLSCKTLAQCLGRTKPKWQSLVHSETKHVSLNQTCPTRSPKTQSLSHNFVVPEIAFCGGGGPTTLKPTSFCSSSYPFSQSPLCFSEFPIKIPNRSKPYMNPNISN